MFVVGNIETCSLKGNIHLLGKLLFPLGGLAFVTLFFGGALEADQELPLLFAFKAFKREEWHWTYSR